MKFPSILGVNVTSLGLLIYIHFFHLSNGYFFVWECLWLVIYGKRSKTIVFVQMTRPVKVPISYRDKIKFGSWGFRSLTLIEKEVICQYQLRKRFIAN